MMRKTAMKRGTALLKRAPMKRASKKPRSSKTKKLMSTVAELGCVVCRNLGFGQTPAELHHPRFLAGGAQKAPDEDVIPLCPSHHRLGGYGVAYHAGPKEWESRYGSEEALLHQTKQDIKSKSDSN